MTKVVFGRPPQAVCCANPNNCVIWNQCVSPGSSVYDVDGDEDTDYCVNNGGNGEWADCGSDSNCAANEWCNTGTKDCVNDLGLCSATACNRDEQCLGSLKCINNKCRVAATEAGLCSNSIDDDCDGKTDGDDTDCCGSSGDDCPGGDGDCCTGTHYCSDTNPHDLTSVCPKCCTWDNINGVPDTWWDPTFGATGGCRDFDICNPECQSNPFSPWCISGDSLYGCCDFEGLLVDQEIITY